jgi:hypothetical protein
MAALLIIAIHQNSQMGLLKTDCVLASHSLFINVFYIRLFLIFLNNITIKILWPTQSFVKGMELWPAILKTSRKHFMPRQHPYMVVSISGLCQLAIIFISTLNPKTIRIKQNLIVVSNT